MYTSFCCKNKKDKVNDTLYKKVSNLRTSGLHYRPLRATKLMGDDVECVRGQPYDGNYN